MRREPGVHRRRIALSFREQDPEHVRYAARIDAGDDGVLHGLIVGLRLVLAAEAGDECIGAGADDRLAEAAVADLRQGAHQHQAAVHLVRLLHLLHRVAQGHVADLVPEHAGDLVHRHRALDQAAIDVDPAAGHGKGIHFLAVHDRKVPRQPARVGTLGQRLAERIEVLVDLRVADDRQLRVDLRRVRLPHRDFLLRRDRARRRDDRGGKDAHGTGGAPEGAGDGATGAGHDRSLGDREAPGRFPALLAS